MMSQSLSVGMMVIYLADGVPLPLLSAGGSKLLPSLHIGLGRENVQVHLGQCGGGAGREGFPLGLWSSLQTFIGDTLAWDVTNTTINTSHHLSANNKDCQVV